MPHLVPLLADVSAFGVAITLFAVILGLLVTLNPSKRTYEIKRDREE